MVLAPGCHPIKKPKFGWHPLLGEPGLQGGEEPDWPHTPTYTSEGTSHRGTALCDVDSDPLQVNIVQPGQPTGIIKISSYLTMPHGRVKQVCAQREWKISACAKWGPTPNEFRHPGVTTPGELHTFGFKIPSNLMASTRRTGSPTVCIYNSAQNEISVLPAPIRRSRTSHHKNGYYT